MTNPPKKRGRKPRERRGGFASIDGALDVELPIDDAWRAACRRRIEELGTSQEDLARFIGCVQSSLSAALAPGRSTSSYAHAISLALSVPLSIEARIALLTRRAMARSPEAFTAIVAALEKTFEGEPDKPDQ